MRIVGMVLLSVARLAIALFVSVFRFLIQLALGWK